MADQDARDLFDRFNPILEPRPSVAADVPGRGAPQGPYLIHGHGTTSVDVTLESLRKQLAAQGLHVVTAADKAVLDVENALLEQAANAIDEACYPVWWDAYRDYIARREAAK